MKTLQLILFNKNRTDIFDIVLLPIRNVLMDQIFKIYLPPQIEYGGSVREGYAPCSLRHFTSFSLLPSIFRRSLLFTIFHCSFFISLCSLLLSYFSSCSLIISLAPCSISRFFAAPCSLFQFFVLPAPRLHFPCSLPYFRPCFLLPWVSRAILPAP